MVNEGEEGVWWAGGNGESNNEYGGGGGEVAWSDNKSGSKGKSGQNPE